MASRRWLRILPAASVGVGFVLGACGGTRREAASVSVRDCSMVGFGGLSADYRRRAAILGPLALANLNAYRADQPLPGHVGNRYGAYEIIAVVRHGTQPRLSLPRREWATVGLLYDPHKFRDDGAYRIQDLAQTVQFRACNSPRFNHGVSQFDGGFVVSRRQCVRFFVTYRGRRFNGQFPAGAACS